MRPSLPLVGLSLALLASCRGPHVSLCEAQVRADCELRYRCCTTEELLVGLGVDVGTYATSEGECIDRLLPTCEGTSAALDEAVALGRIGFDDVNATECRALLEEARDRCDTSISLDARDARLGREGPCALVSVGLVENEADCAGDIECKDDGVCVFDDPLALDIDDELGVIVGACRNPARAGESCLDRGCVDGLFCDAGTCRALPVEGEACPDFACASGFVCEDGTCARLPEAGEPCEFLCGAGAFCSSVEPRVCEEQKRRARRAAGQTSPSASTRSRAWPAAVVAPSMPGSARGNRDARARARSPVDDVVHRRGRRLLRGKGARRV